MTSLVKVTVCQLWSITFSVPSQLTAAIDIDKQLASYASRCKSGRRLLYYSVIVVSYDTIIVVSYLNYVPN